MDLLDEIIRAAEELAGKIKASAIIVISPRGQEIRKMLRTSIPVLIARMGRSAAGQDDISLDIHAKLPRDVGRESLFFKVSRIELMSEAVEAAYIKGKIHDKVVLGIVSIGDVNSIVVMDITDIPLIRKMADLVSLIDYNILKAVLNLAIEIGREGREGKSVGTAFIIGDTDRVLGMSHQIILNPYEGHKKATRDVRNEDNWESVKEFAQLDGMFIMDERGYIVAAGRYLDVNAHDVALPPGLGGRHLAAAAITKASRSIAITVSESSGSVTVYKNGHSVFQLNPRISIA
jgi:DNA integrity scanning protein DisA with diadenylate cyclase activity